MQCKLPGFKRGDARCDDDPRGHESVGDCAIVTEVSNAFRLGDLHG
jgi:hypothetical protein